MVDILLSYIRENAAFMRRKRADLRIPIQIVGAVVRVVAVVIVAAGCGIAGGGQSPTVEEPSRVTITPTQAEPTETSTSTPTVEVHPIHIGLAVDQFGIDDNGQNAAVWAGIQRAVAELPGVEATYLEVVNPEDFDTIVDQLIADGNDLIITTQGVFFSLNVGETGPENPDVKFASVDWSYDPAFDDNPFPYAGSNHSGLIFNAQEGAFLAGYLASGMSQTGVVGTFGAVNHKPLTRFMDGYKCGIQYYNEQKAGTSIFSGLFNGLASTEARPKSNLSEYARRGTSVC